MLIHRDGNSNVVQASMLDGPEWIQDKNINIVLMNLPYNVIKKFCGLQYTKVWDSKKKEDSSKGFHFVEWVARHVHNTDMPYFKKVFNSISENAIWKAYYFEDTDKKPFEKVLDDLGIREENRFVRKTQELYL